MNSTVVYSTSTDGTVFNALPEPLPFPVVREEVWDDFCFVCGRCTDHFGEHDDIPGIVYEQEITQYGSQTVYYNRTYVQSEE